MFEVTRTCKRIGDMLIQTKLFDLRKKEIHPVQQDQDGQHSWINRWRLPVGEYLEMRAMGPTHARQVNYSLLVVGPDGSERTKMLDPVPIFL
ncbi:MAG TPA: hypothetical protein VMW83_00215 [Spirochaetia bacterium]|nr:hypothetical protein [Spirochaetia bacterium]